MAKKKGAAKMVRVVEGIYKRGDAYLVPIYHADLNGPGKAGKRWHSLTNCGPECQHVQIVDLATAKAAKRKLEDQKVQVRARGGSDKTVKEWAGSTSPAVPLWLKTYPRKGEGTMVHNAERVRGFGKSDLKDRSLRSLTQDEVWGWCDGHPSTFNALRACLNDALKAQLIDVNHLDNYGAVTSRGRRDIVTLSLPELDDILLPTAREEWGDFGEAMEGLVELGAWTGMRPGELFLLSTQPGNDLNGGRVNYVDLKRGFIDVQWQWNPKLRKATRPKWDSMRKVALLPRARAVIERTEDSAEGWVFVTQRGQRMTQRHLHYYWDPVRRAFTKKLPASHWLPLRIADLGPKKGNLDFYELRHYFGTALAQPPAGIKPASEREIMDQMGHKDPKVTAIYVHMKNQDVVDSLAASWAAHAPRSRKDAA